MKKHCLFILLAAISFSSCKKFLAERTQSDLTPQTTDDFKQLLIGTAYPLQGDVFNPCLFLLDDDIQCYTKDIPDPGTVTPGDIFTWQPDGFRRAVDRGFNAANVSSYEMYYKKIIGCNIAIQEVDKSLGKPQEKDQVIGEAYTLRAFYYFNLVNLYGKPYNDSTTTPDKSPGVPLVISANLSEKLLPRNSVAEVYAQIEKDLDSANARLRKFKLKNSVHRISHIASAFLQSRFGLFTEKWDGAIAAADYVINNSKLPVLDLNDWPPGWSTWNDDDPKPIYCDPTPETIWLYGMPEDYNSGTNSYNMSYEISEDLGTQFEEKDLRASIYLVKVPDFLLGWLFAAKYLTLKRGTKSYEQQGGASLRLTEVYLNRAEAYAQKYATTGDANFAQKALSDLNFIRSKRFTPADFVPVAMMPAADLLQFIRNERRREFCTENMRWFDLRRYGMPAIRHIYNPSPAIFEVYTLQKRDLSYVLQIPQSAIDRNMQLEQNPTSGSVRNPN